MSMKLMPGTPAPALSVPLLGGGTFDLAQSAPEAFTMIVVYRGYHCPVCKDYIGKLNGVAAAFAEKGVRVVTLSMDGADRAEKAKAEWGLDALEIGYGLTEDVARSWGLWISSSIKEAETDVFAEPGTFWVLPDGTLYLIDISNMPFGRPDLDILLSKVPAVANGYPPRGTKAS